MKNLYIIGAGGFSTEVLFLIERINLVENKWNNIYFIDDHLPKGAKIRGIEIVGDLLSLESIHDEIDVIISINDCITRESIVKRIKEMPYKINFPNLFDPSAIIDFKMLKIGEGNIFMHNVIISTNVDIGDFNIFNSYVGVGHDSIVKSFNTFNPRVAISGKVYIGSKNYFGMNASVVQDKVIGSGNEIWVNSTILRNIKDGMKYFGVPAKKISI